MNPVPKDDLPLVTLQMDHIGPIDATVKGYKYLLVVVDGFSKFTWIYPVKTTSAQDVIDRFEQLTKIFGYPQRIVTDKGSAFTSHDFQQFCELNNIQHWKTTTGVPRGNGQVERVNAVIISVLSKVALDDSSKWYKYVDKVQRCINSTYHRVINKTPHEVLTGVPMRTENDMRINEIIHEELVAAFCDEREEERKLVRDDICRAQGEQKRQWAV